jgi:hypothetical protein
MLWCMESVLLRGDYEKRQKEERYVTSFENPQLLIISLLFLVTSSDYLRSLCRIYKQKSADKQKVGINLGFIKSIRAKRALNSYPICVIARQRSSTQSDTFTY